MCRIVPKMDHEEYQRLSDLYDVDPKKFKKTVPQHRQRAFWHYTKFSLTTTEGIMIGDKTIDEVVRDMDQSSVSG